MKNVKGVDVQEFVGADFLDNVSMETGYTATYTQPVEMSKTTEALEKKQEKDVKLLQE